MKRSTILEIICSLLILLFLYASVSKWLNFREFILDIHNQPFPGWLATSIVWFLPPVEILIALTLLFEKTRTIGLWAALILMTIFTIYTGAILLHFFNRVPCGCGGVIRGLTWAQHLIFNLFFVAVSGIGIVINGKNYNQIRVAIRQPVGAV